MVVGDIDLFVGAIDQGTSSTRFIIFNLKNQDVVVSRNIEIDQSYPHEGWVEECPEEILASCLRCIDLAVDDFLALNYTKEQIKCIGITNQRETTIIWDRITGKALHPAIVWCDSRTEETVKKLIQDHGSKDILRKKCGLPLATYFSALKIQWLMENKPEVKEGLADGTALIGTVDSWLLWKMTGEHVTDVTNASRTMLLNLNTLEWDDSLCEFFSVPINALPRVCSSAQIYGNLNSTKLNGTPISGILGDQQAALLGQGCTKMGMAKNTYGTGCFLLQNTGTQILQSKSGLLTTVAYKLGKNAETHYALEGSIAAAGSILRWLRDNLGIVNEYRQIDGLACKVKDSGNLIFVPAFNGLYAPYWRPDARGTMTGITQHTNKNHMAFAAYEAACFQTCDLFEAIERDDSSAKLSFLRVDGGLTSSKIMLQRLADLLEVTVERPNMSETTSLGAALAAAIGANLLNFDDIKNLSTVEQFLPSLTAAEVATRKKLWKIAVQKSFNSAHE